MKIKTEKGPATRLATRPVPSFGRNENLSVNLWSFTLLDCRGRQSVRRAGGAGLVRVDEGWGEISFSRSGGVSALFQAVLLPPLKSQGRGTRDSECGMEIKSAEGPATRNPECGMEIKGAEGSATRRG